MTPLSVDRLRRIDAIAIDDFGISSLVLMENAGRGAADRLATLAPRNGRIVILCGSGNNGGDGLVIARHLHAGNHPVSVWMLGAREKLTPDTNTNYGILAKTSVPCRWVEEIDPSQGLDTDHPGSIRTLKDLQASLHSAAMIVDAMLGTGARGEPRGRMAQAIQGANKASAIRIAIDIPTGLDADTGTMAATTWLADHTLTLVAPKLCFSLDQAQRCLGKITVLPIGIPPEVLARV
jgi:NAD(P)H-hydrate epimerase